MDRGDELLHRRGLRPAGKPVRRASGHRLARRGRRRAGLAGMDRPGAESARGCRAQGSSDPVRAHHFDRVGRGASPVLLPGRLRRQGRTTRRSDPATKRLARPSAYGRAAGPHLEVRLSSFAPTVDPARADYDFLGGQPLDPAKRTARGDRSGPMTFPGRRGFNRVARRWGMANFRPLVNHARD